MTSRPPLPADPTPYAGPYPASVGAPRTLPGDVPIAPNAAASPPPIARIVTATGIVALTFLAIVYGRHTPTPVSTSAPATDFSAERAMAHVRQIAQRPHPAGSQDNARVREYLMTELRALSLTPEIQDVTGVGTRYAVSGRVRNVLARVPGTQSGGKAVLVMAHYDGVPAGPAAGDDGAGSAALLEALRALRAGSPPVHDVIALFTDAEEDGLLGAAAFVREHRWLKDVAVVLNFEARGTDGPSYMFETGPGNLSVVRALRRVTGVRATSLTTAVYRQLPNDTDLSEIMPLGLPAMNFAFIGRVDHYHTTQDDPAHLDRGSLQHHGNQMLALTRAFADGPLPLARTSDAVFFDFPILGLIVYAERWAIPLAIIGLVLTIIAIGRLRRCDQRWLSGIVVGALGTVVAAIVGGAATFGVGVAVARLHASLGGTPQFSAAYLIGATLFAVAVAFASYATARRWGGANGLFLGALLVWGFLALVVAMQAPGMSFVFVWPLLASVPAALQASASATARAREFPRWLAAFVVICLIAPTLYGVVALALGLAAPASALLGVLSSLALWALAPHLEAMGAQRWRPAIYSTSAAVLCCLLGLATVRTGEARPVGASLVYAVDSGGRAWLTGYGWGAAGRNWVKDAATSLRADASGEAPQWVYYAGSREAVARAPSPSAPLEPPTSTIIADSTTGATRHVTVRVRAASGTLNVLMRADSGTVLGAAVDGRTVDITRYRRQSARWQLEFVAPPDSGFMLTLAVPAGTRPALDFVARSSGMPALQGVTLPARPAGVIPAQTGDMTVTHRRIIL